MKRPTLPEKDAEGQNKGPDCRRENKNMQDSFPESKRADVLKEDKGHSAPFSVQKRKKGLLAHVFRVLSYRCPLCRQRQESDRDERKLPTVLVLRAAKEIHVCRRASGGRDPEKQHRDRRRTGLLMAAGSVLNLQKS